MSSVIYALEKAKHLDIVEHLKKCDKNFSPLLSSYVNIEEYSKKIFKNAITFEAWVNNELVGLVACYLNDKKSLQGYITNVSVLETFVGKGIAKRLLLNCEEYSRNEKYKSLSLEVKTNNDKALSLYKKLGFEVDRKERENYKMEKLINKNTPLVSISCLTYNHVKYIRETLESFMMQKTNFPFEVLVHDDASTDGTTEIVKEFEAKYPDIIKPIYQTDNQYSKGVSMSITYNFPRAKGKYIAMCEGDDYWTDPLKLQKQVDFLETNDDYVIAYHNAKIINDKNEIIVKSKLSENLKKDFTQDELIKGVMLLTLTICFRNVISDFPEEFFKVKNGDKFLTSLLGNYGKGKYLGEIKNAVYRKHKTSVWSSLDKTSQIFYNGDTRAWLSRYYYRIGNYSYASYFQEESIKLLDQVLSLTSSNNSDNNFREKIDRDYKDLMKFTGDNLTLIKLDDVRVEENILQNIEEKDSTITWCGKKNPEFQVNWIITRKCNYDCNYCTVVDNKNGFFVDKESLVTAIDKLQKIQKEKFHFVLSGGEPTIHPNYIDLLLEVFSKFKDRARVTTITNLSKPMSFYSKLIDSIGEYKNQIRFITSYHFDFARKENFIERIKFLHSNQVKLQISIMAHPEFMDDVKNLDKELSPLKNDITSISIMMIRQDYGSEPDNRYTKEDVNWLKNINQKETKVTIPISYLNEADDSIIETETTTNELIGNNKNNFKGYLCNAGIDIISIDQFGDTAPAVCFRGSSLYKENLFDKRKEFVPSNEPIVCPFESCACPADLSIYKEVPQKNKFSKVEQLQSFLEEKNWKEKEQKYSKVFKNFKILNEIKNPQISIIIISWRLHPDTLKNLEILEKQRDQNFELIFVNNGADRNEFVSLEPFINKYIILNQNTGAYLARNIGSLFAESPILFFLEDDGIPEKNIIEEHLKVHNKYEIIAARGVYKFKTENPLNKIASHYFLGEKPFPIYADLEGNTTYKADLFYKVGGWDDNIRFGGGGVELSIRLLLEEPDKRKQIYTPGPVIYHDYAKDEEHFNNKREKQKKSRKRLLTIHPNWDEYLRSWEKYWNNSSELICKENENKTFTSDKIKNPKITICIPTYNRAEYLKEAVDSALNQNYENYEILIVDDGSTDNTSEMVKSINSDKIKYFKSEENLGRPKVRNKLVTLSKGEFLLWLDDDDKLRENILDDYVKILLANPKVNIIYGNLLQFDDETGKEIQRYEPNDYSKSKVDMLRNLILGSGITFPASLIKKELFEQCGYFDEEYLRAQDYELWSRLYEKAKFYKVNDIVCYYRKHNSNVSFGTTMDHSYEAKVVKKVLSKYTLSDLFVNFDLLNLEVLDNIYYHLALSLHNFQDYNNAIFYLNKISNPINSDYIKLMFATYLSLGNQNLIEKFVDSFKDVDELKELYQEFKNIIANYNKLHNQIEDAIELKKWNKLESIIQQMNEELGYISEVPFYLGVLNEQEKDFNVALEYYKQAVRFNPNNEKFYNAALNLTDDNSKIVLNKMRERILLKEEPKEIESNIIEQALVSVIIPTFNRASFLKQSLQSVLNQTYQNFEILVINDAGKDVQNVVAELKDTRIKYFCHSENRGPTVARNTGLHNAKGKYISYLDDDDTYYSNHLENLVSKFESTNYKVVYSDAYCITHKGEGANGIIKSKSIPYSFDFSKELLLLMNIAPTQCFMHHRDCIQNVGSFDEDFLTHEDWEFWIRLSQKYDFLHIKQVTSEFNRRESTEGLTSGNLEDFLRTMKIIFERYNHLVKGNENILKAQKERVNNLFNDVKQQHGASIIIVTYNSEGSIATCINSLKKTLRNYDEVVIVDNNSKDKTISIIKKIIKNSKQFKIVQSEKNLGFSEGCNVGIKNSSNPFVVLLNPDTTVTEKWLEKMVSVCRTKNVAAVGPTSNYAAGYQNVSAYIEPNELKILNLKQIPIEIERRYNKQTVETKLLIGFCMMIKRTLLNELGGLDKELFLGNDDLDLSWQFRLKGYKLLVALDTFVFHEGQVSFKTEKESITDLLVKESTDKLYEKLVNHYGKGNVPTPLELWGMKWFTPTTGKFNNATKLLDKKTKGVSIVIPTFNQWEYTKQTIESIEAFTDFSYEIIIIDNASTDNTIENLKKYENVKVISNNKNLGFPIAVNQGIKEAKGDYILILNNDVVVTNGWLSKMVEVANLKENIGIVGPISNSVSGLQIDKDAKYSTMDDMHIYAKQISVKNKNQTIEFPRLAFLCTLIKREVIEKIGGLDERFSPGNFEDDDFCLRSQLAGYKSVIARDVFIHHYGSVSFKANGENKYAKRLETNGKIFVEKWGATPEGVWLKAENIKDRKLECPINTDLFNQSIARAFINIDDEEYDFAIQNLKLALENYEGSERVGYENITKEEILNLAGTLLLSKNELEEAKNCFELELNENPNSSTACFGLGEVFYQAEMIEDSKSMFEWAIVNNDDNQDAHTRLREVNTKLNLPEEHNAVLLEETERTE